ncbi:hypothetical protein MOJ79_16155 [Calidifontimicrobium sp. SYSU G02091]|uniref:hypothetical protein n=1 Tax=Calidifontimicrobium sp. SYSU G02091 TaxID=2926421 RepID=UPI001F52C11C|nr:hypothetical protein [Calidifontimicrobium sp. SYSU G02091]MCI1193371.1 hypothetical protein [Calidifontimicrobium sp. SYSU G02091]
MKDSFDIARARRRPGPSCWLAASVLLLAQPALADCPLRAATPKERDYIARLQASLLAALPAAPAHMALTAAPRAQVSSLCEDTAEGEVRASALATYRYALPQAEADRIAQERAQLEAQIKSLQTLPPPLKQEFDALEAQRQEAFRDARRAERAGDKALASQKYKEASAFEEQGRAVHKRHLDTVKLQLDELEARRLDLPPSSADLQVRLEANGWGSAARSHETELRLGALPPPSGFRFKVHGLQAIVAGPRGADAQRNALLAAFDRARLQTLIDQPLPQEPPPAAWHVGPAPVAAAPAAAPTPAAAPPSAGVSTAGASPTSAPPAPAPAAPDAAQMAAEKAKEAVGKLRSLFGR